MSFSTIVNTGVKTSGTAGTLSATRNIKSKMINFALKEAWTEAQAKTSMLSKFCRKVDQVENFKLWKKLSKRSFARRNGGVTATPSSTQLASRRALYIQEYDDALQVDISDLVDAQGNVIEESKRLLKFDLARIIDNRILDSMIAPVQETQSSSVGSAPAKNTSLRAENQITASFALDSFRKDVVFAKATIDTTATVHTATISTLTAGDLEDLLYIFRARDVEGDLVMTLTPELGRILRKDSEFKNAENTFHNGSLGGSAFSAIYYRGINFVPVSNSVLPVLDSSNIGTTVPLRALNGSAIRGRAYKSATAAAAQNATDFKRTSDDLGRDNETFDEDNYGKATIKKNNMAYIWHPDSILCAMPMDRTISRESELPEQSYAKQLYTRIAIGCVSLDEQHSAVVVVKA